jgi:branched-chain amino acid transport system permease protein
MTLLLFLELIVSGLATGALYAVIAAGFVLVYRATSVTNFAIGEFLLVGAYLVYTLSLFMPAWLALLLSLPLAFAFGVLVERGFVRPLLGRNVVAVIMATIGLAATVDGAVQLIWGPSQKAYSGALPDLKYAGAIFLSSRTIWSLVLALPLALLLVGLLKYSRYGILLRAVSESETAALAMGINAPRVVAVAWGFSAALAAIGGAFLTGIAGGGAGGPDLTIILLGLIVFPVAIFGGFDSVVGAVIAGLLMGLIESLSRFYLDRYLPGITQAIPFIIVLLVLLVRPYGLLGQHRIERV